MNQRTATIIHMAEGDSITADISLGPSSQIEPTNGNPPSGEPSRRDILIWTGAISAAVAAGRGAYVLNELASMPPPPEGYDIGKIQTLPLTPTMGTHFEVTPWIVPENESFTITTAYTAEAKLSGSLTNLGKTELIGSGYVTRDLVNAGKSEAKPWARNWNGIFTEHVIDTPHGQTLIALHSGENKNERRGDRVFQNTVDPSLSAKEKASGYDAAGRYSDDWDSYNAFVTMSWAQNTGAGAQRIEEGPIVWPANGYKIEGAKSSNGVRQPHGFVGNGYIWMYYEDMSFGQDGRARGIRLARSSIESEGKPGSWQVYNNGEWVNALPEGFDRDRIEDFYETHGPASTPIIPADSNQVSFAVARNERGGYMGLEERIVNNNAWEVRMWKSDDLIHWKVVKTIATAPDWGSGTLHFPVFLSGDGKRTDEIDGNRFSIIGTGNDRIQSIEISRKGQGTEKIQEILNRFRKRKTR